MSKPTLEEIIAAVNTLRTANSMTTDEFFEHYNSNGELSGDKEKIEEFYFSGLSNVDFIRYFTNKLEES
jgi:hypothetical protein